MKKVNKLWGSAFKRATPESTIKFTAGRDVYPKKPADYNLIPYDLWGNKAHCIMLYQQGLISKKDAQIILKGLNEIENLWEKDEFLLDPSKEDVHTNIESWLIEKYGLDNVGKLHTARSRNDQSNLDTRLYLKDQALSFLETNIALVQTLLAKAKEYKSLIMPGFTHHQHAVPTSFGHILMAFASMVLRDNEKFINWLDLHNLNPLGAVAAYGSTLPIDQELTTDFFGFDAPEKNSLDAITNKWEAESGLAFAITVLMNHLSSLAQTLIIFSTPEFDFIKLDENYSTGSSIMPQKKNPDSLEAIKAKTSVASGTLQALLGIGKANFIGYNRDSQWSKYLIMDLIEECLTAPNMLGKIVNTLSVNKKKTEKWAHKDFIGSTGLLEQLVSEYKIPFRKAKIIVEKAIKYSPQKDKVVYEALIKILDEEGVSIKIKEDEVIKWQDPAWIVKHIKSLGGPGLVSMQKMAEKISQDLNSQCNFLNDKKDQINKGRALLNNQINELLKKNL